MPRVAKAPRGFYTATEAIRLLRIPKATFFYMVKTGKIKKIVQPGMTDGYYLKAAIDDLVKARELFTVQYATDAPSFEKATEEDIKGLYDLCVSLWGTRGTYSYDLRLARYKKNPDIFYVLKYLDIVVGYSTVMPISKRAVDEIMQGEKKAWQAIALDDILPFTPGEPIEYLFLEIAVRDGVPRPRHYAMQLISGTIRVLEELAERGVTVEKLFAVSSLPDGIRISRELGFKETPISPDGSRLAFELDVKKSASPFLRGYQQIIKRRSKQALNNTISEGNSIISH